MIAITLARKPLIGTVVKNVLIYGTGGLNTDSSRIRIVEGESIHITQSNPAKREGVVGTDLGISRASVEQFQQAQRESIARTNTLGRWPSNLILCHSENCKMQIDSGLPRKTQPGVQSFNTERGWNNPREGATASESYEKETVSFWDCAPGCSVGELREVSRFFFQVQQTNPGLGNRDSE